MIRSAAFALSAAGIFLGATAALAQEKGASAGKCFMAGGEATMLTEGLARFMANAALNNSIKGANAKATGTAKVTCKDGVASVYCIAQQRACK